MPRYSNEPRTPMKGFSPIGGGGLNQLYAMNAFRGVPAFYNPNSPTISAEEIAGDAAKFGERIDRQGERMPGSPFWKPPQPPAQATQPQVPTTAPAPGGAGIWQQMMNGGRPVAQQQEPMQSPAAQSPPMASTPQVDERGQLPFAERLAAARAAVQERKNLQDMEAANRREQFTQPQPGQVAFQSKYGTGSNVPTGRPATFEGVSKEEFFRGAANRQRTANKFAKPDDETKTA